MFVYDFGEVQAVHALLSSLHSNVESTSVAAKENVAVVTETVPLGPLVIEVFGATVSTVHVRVAGVGSTIPAAFLALTENVCEPFESLE
jgi:hypothetical protein